MVSGRQGRLFGPGVPILVISPPHEHINWKSTVTTVATVRDFFDFKP
jgi:hypothetical protein